MVFLRRFFRFVSLIIWFMMTGPLAAPFMFGGWKSIKRVSRITRLWGHGITKVLNINVKVHGDISSFEGGLIVSNHMGYFDIITHSSVFPIRFTPKKEISRWPLLGWYLSLSRPIWIDRRSKRKSQETMNAFKETMERKIPLLVYPEGTSTDGLHGLLPFKSTPFEAAAQGNFPILPILTVYSDPSVCWYGKMSLVPHVWKVAGYKSIDVDLYVLPIVHPEGRSRKEIAGIVHDMLEKEYRRIHSERQQGAVEIA
ncbi:MAG: hypothetical protein A2020_02235 [Lentisphaerae bacterium GWF2_45_14]|nr:MAG: hypothetical protein A2020_02235 [Lentisphaerae bacterium GWF2_45_14]